MSTKETALDTPNVMASVRGACADFGRERGLTEPHLKLLTLTALGRPERVIGEELTLDAAGLEAARADFVAAAGVSLEGAVEQVTEAALSSLRR